MKPHVCTGDESCPSCSAVIEVREAIGVDESEALSYQRADGTWRRGSDWHVPADAPRNFPGGL